MPLPNFLIIGAMKSGTTALYFALKHHPQIFMSPVKEPNFFVYGENDRNLPLEGNKNIVYDMESYLALYDEAKNKVALGEASHSYLYIPGTAERILHFISDVKLICILRNPVDRAYSHYLFLLRDGIEPHKDFSLALREEEKRIKKGISFGHYIHRGFYYRQLKRYYDVFRNDQIYVCLYDDLKGNPVSLIQTIYDFLGVDASFIPDISIRRNPSGVPRSKLLHALLVRPNPIKRLIQPILPVPLYRLATNIRDHNLDRPAISKDTRSELLEIYRDDIIKLQNMIQRDLSAWFI